jgi:hypothetical protein
MIESAQNADSKTHIEKTPVDSYLYSKTTEMDTLIYKCKSIAATFV